jgi:hypothetical protein
MSKTGIYDYIIIGTGIAGLYSAYQIKIKDKTARIIILEQNKRADIGGRIGTDNFYGVQIAKGAGIGRKKDEVLVRLLREFGFPIHSYVSSIEYSPLFYDKKEPTDINDRKQSLKQDIQQVVKYLRKEFKENKKDTKHENTKKTFREFSLPLLGKEVYDEFIMKVGYQDFENTDIEEALYYYGFEDDICCNEIFHIDWNELIERFIEKIGITHFKFSQTVESIEQNEPNYKITTTSNIYFGKKIIVATTIKSLRKLFPDYPIYREIEGQPYLRIYGKFSKTSLPFLKESVKTYTVLPSILQKIIPINPEKGVYMIVYNDNRNAYFLRNKLENTEKNRGYYERILEKSLALPKNSLELIAIKSYYWEIGTHYYSPLDRTQYKSRNQFIKEAQHPAENILVVGEVVSRKQGWTEGALESVEAIFNL